MDHQLKGRVSFSVGETVLSAWEAARLAPGDIVLTTREAGYPGFLLFNNLPIALGEVVILEGTFGVRIVDTDFRPSFQVDPGRIDAVGEMVPAVVELGGFEAGLDELSGLGRHSFINLGRPFPAQIDAVLVYAGVPLARGKVVVVGETMGLRVAERLVDLPLPALVRQSGNLADRGAMAQAKDYNFAMPDKWSREQIRRLDDIHRLFQRNLEASWPEASRTLAGSTDGLVVDQCTLGEARASLAQAGLGSFTTWEHEGPRRSREGSVPPRTLLFEAPGCPLPLSASTKSFLEGLVAPQGVFTQRPVYLHRGAEWAGSDLKTLAQCLRNGWKKLLDFRLDEPSPGPVANALADHEMVILVLLRRDASSPPVLALVYPFLTLEPYMKLLGN